MNVNEEGTSRDGLHDSDDGSREGEHDDLPVVISYGLREVVCRTYMCNQIDPGLDMCSTRKRHLYIALQTHDPCCAQSNVANQHAKV